MLDTDESLRGGRGRGLGLVSLGLGTPGDVDDKHRLGQDGFDDGR